MSAAVRPSAHAEEEEEENIQYARPQTPLRTKKKKRREKIRGGKEIGWPQCSRVVQPTISA